MKSINIIIPAILSLITPVISTINPCYGSCSWNYGPIIDQIPTIVTDDQKQYNTSK